MLLCTQSTEQLFKGQVPADDGKGAAKNVPFPYTCHTPWDLTHTNLCCIQQLTFMWEGEMKEKLVEGEILIHLNLQESVG